MIRVALTHETTYTYDRPVTLGPQILRLRPAPHCKTPITSYSLKVQPEEHFVNWQQDPHGNFLARHVFPKPVDFFSIKVDFIAEMTVINPFDFFVEDSAAECPFAYESWLTREIAAFLETEEFGPTYQKFLKSIDRTKRTTVDFLVDVNNAVHQAIEYEIRMEPGVQSPEETLRRASGSCRDSAWLLLHLFRGLGLAARFVSGYLIQLKADVAALDGPSGAETDFTDLHAWTEVYVPGAGWIGLDPTSGLLAGEGHIPVASTPDFGSAAPVSGAVGQCKTDFAFSMNVTRVHEDPRVTKPYTESQWTAIHRLGHEIDQRLRDGDVRLTMGGEPTFVSIDDMDGAEWNVAAVGEDKRKLSERLIKRLRKRFAPGGLLHYGQGKWYPGEELPRWALACFWRLDGEPIWKNPDLIADVDRDYGYKLDDASRLAKKLAENLGVDSKFVITAYEDAFHYRWKEQRLPTNVDPRDSKLKSAEERARLARIFENGLDEATGFVLPLERQWWQGRGGWRSGPWPIRTDHLLLVPGDSPAGLRLPLDSIPWTSESPPTLLEPLDPMAPRDPFPPRKEPHQPFIAGEAPATGVQGISEQTLREEPATGEDGQPHPDSEIVRTALCVEARDGRVHIFLPPLRRMDDFLDLVAAIEGAAEELSMPVVVEGYLPPPDSRVSFMKVTPDPGVIEVNIHPAENWDALVDTTSGLYEEARLTRLGTDKFDLDGHHTGTGGGNHIVVGGMKPQDSPFLRRPDLLKSLLGYWLNHPSLSYLFSGRFIGPTSQAPRIDEGRQDALYELELAFSLVPKRGEDCPPWLVDRIFRHLLTDLTGNTHRAEFCIDKLFSPDSSTGRLGLVEFRGFEMPPHWQMSCTQLLLIRALISRFWESPYEQKIVTWDTELHDRFLLPHFVWQDFTDVIDDLKESGFEFDRNWFASHWEFRFPSIGEVNHQDISIDLRTAIEPWYVLGEEPAGGGTARYVDSSVERLQVRVRGMTGSRHVVTCNGRQVPIRSTGTPGEFVAGVRYRAWAPPSCLHPTIPVHAPLVFDLVDTWSGRSIGGCTYSVSHPGGRNSETFPVNANEAEARRGARFSTMGHTPGAMAVPPLEENNRFPYTLDLRRSPDLR